MVLSILSTWSCRIQTSLSETYKYLPLKEGTSELRVLALHPGEWHEDILCSLCTVLLDSNPDFEALSYVWGSPNNLRTIWLHGLPHAVTANLHSALKHLRK